MMWTNRLRNALQLSWSALVRKVVRRAIVRLAESRYDKALGIDTGGEIIREHLMLTLETKDFGKGYAATPPMIAESLIELVENKARGYTFVDYGAGKGRVLLIAARYQFGRVIGVEVSETLIQIAATNIENYNRAHQVSCPIELIHTDAAQFNLPNVPCVLFFFDPFQFDLMEQIGNQIHESFCNNPRKIYIIYYSPAFPQVFEAPFMRRQIVSGLPDGSMNRYGKPTAMIFETMLQ